MTPCITSFNESCAQASATLRYQLWRQTLQRRLTHAERVEATALEPWSRYCGAVQHDFWYGAVAIREGLAYGASYLCQNRGRHPDRALGTGWIADRPPDGSAVTPPDPLVRDIDRIDVTTLFFP